METPLAKNWTLATVPEVGVAVTVTALPTGPEVPVTGAVIDTVGPRAAMTLKFTAVEVVVLPSVSVATAVKL